MEILGFEIDIYFVMVVIVGIFVTTMILFISSHIGTKKRANKSGKRSVIKPKQNRNKLNATSEMESVSRPSEKSVQPQLSKPSGKPSGKEHHKQSDEEPAQVFEKPEIQLKDSNAGNLPDKPAKQAPSYSSNESIDMATAMGSIPAGSSDKQEGIHLVDASSLLLEPDKPVEAKVENVVTDKNEQTAGNKEESKEESEGESGKGGGLMDIFTEDNEEESDSKGLAALLTDVDLSTLNKLTEEMSQVLLKHQSNGKERQ
jgi:hypothetical protein